MPNALKNAGFVDGVTGAVAVNAVLTAPDEVTAGAPGRAVLTAGSQAGGVASLAFGAAPVTVGQPFEAFARTGSGGYPNAVARVAVLNSGGALLGSVIMPIDSAGDGAPRRGLPSTFDRRYVRDIMPASGFARVELFGTAPSAGYQLQMLKPFLALNPPSTRQRFDPGAHDNPDLNLPIWPSALPDFDGGSVQAQPTGSRKEFQGDAGIPSTRRVGLGVGVRFAAEFSLSLEQRDILNQFFLASLAASSDNTQFWFLRPDTQELCFARWSADGDPADTGQSAGGRKTKIGLILTVA